MNIKLTAALSVVSLIAALAGCDMRSDTAKREMEKFSGTPTPTISPAPTEAPIDPSEVVQVDVNVQGDPISVNGYDQKKSVTCSKFNAVTVNGGRGVVTIKGPCRRVMVNGDDNRLTVDAAVEIVLNGDKNTVEYARYVNGKRPLIQDNAGENTVEKVSPAPRPSSPAR